MVEQIGGLRDDPFVCLADGSRHKLTGLFGHLAANRFRAAGEQPAGVRFLNRTPTPLLNHVTEGCQNCSPFGHPTKLLQCLAILRDLGLPATKPATPEQRPVVWMRLPGPQL